jgi:GT2 family glycosyltransferase
VTKTDSLVDTAHQVPRIALSIIIVNWNSREYVKKCVASINAHTPGMPYEIIVIDSGSFDGCNGMLQRTYPQVRFVQSQVNVGFGRANTLAAGCARGSVLLFLNPDTEVTDGAIDEMYCQLRIRSDAGVLGCRLLNSDGSLQTSCVQAFPTIANQLLSVDFVHRWFPKTSLFGNGALFDRESAVTEVEAVSGACMMMRREVFESVGGFSAEYFMYGEDMDLCFKTRRHGLHNYHVRDSVVIHHGGGSSRHAVSRFSAVMMVDSVNQFLRKSRGALHSWGYRLGSAFAAVVRLVVLCVLAPAALVRGSMGRWHAIVEKWHAILRWALGLEHWTTDYNRSLNVTRSDRGAGSVVTTSIGRSLDE